MNRNIVISIALTLFVINGYAQRLLTGVVKDEGGNLLPGVNIVLKSSGLGTVTDIDGVFNITCDGAEETLVLSMIGFKEKTVLVGDETNLSIVLNENVEQLSELVVTAVGLKANKRQLSYSVQQVESDALIKEQQTNVVNALSGKAAGVQIISSSGSPGASSAIRIRGSASINGDNSPLFVVDGVPIDNQQTGSGNPDDGRYQTLDGVDNSNRAIDLNPNDIESISVLKGGAATALYGLRAANGVVIVTTKKGANTSGKPKFLFSNSLGINTVNKLPETQKLYSQGSGGKHQNPDFGANDRHSWGQLISDLRYDGDKKYQWDKNGRLVHKDDASATSQQANIYDNNGDFFRPGMFVDNNLSVSFGGEKNQYFFSLGNRSETGVVPHSEYRKTSFKVTATSQLTDKLSTTASVGYINSGGNRVQRGSNISGVMLGLFRTPVTFDNSNGLGRDAANNAEAYLFNDGTQRAYRGLADYGTRTLQAIYDNPFFTTAENSMRDNVNRVMAYNQLSYELNSNIDLVYRIGTDFYSDRKKTIFAIGSGAAAGGEGRIAEDQVFNQDINSDLYLTYNKQIAEDFSLNLVGGHNYYTHRFQRFYNQGDYISVPGFFHLQNTLTPLVRNKHENKNTAAVYFNSNIGYKDYLFLTLTGRNEWSSTLPEKNNSFFYYSTGLGFVFSDAFALKNDWFSYGKLRAAYSEIGNDAPVYRTSTVYKLPSPGDGWTDGINFPYNGVSAVSRYSLLGSDKLKPEKLISIEFGGEFRFLKDKIGLDLTYFKNLSVDQIIDVPVAPSTGYEEMVMNAGRIENSGLEASVLGTIFSGDFNWSARVNFTKLKSNVLELAPGVDVISLVGFTSTSSRVIVGKGYGAIYGQGWKRNENGQKIIGDDGYPILESDPKFLGDPNPDWTAGITNEFSYKNFSFSFLWDIRQGGMMWNGTKGALVTMGTHKLTENRGEKIVFEGVTESGEVNSKEVTLSESWYRGNGGGFSGNAEDYVEETSWVRLRNVTLGYALPSGVLDGTLLNGLNISLSSNNLLLFTKYSGVDPETSLVGSGNGSGAMDYFNNPGVKSFILSLTAKF